MGFFNRSKKDDDSMIADVLGYEPLGDYVTKKRVDQLQDLLDEDEKVMYLTQGGTIDVEGAGSGTSVFGNDRSRKSSARSRILTAMTDRRILIHIPQITGNDERTIPYQNITSVDLDTGLVLKRLSIQTAGPTYHIQIGNKMPEKEECREIVQYIRKKVDEAQQTESQPVTDPTEQLKRLKELYDDEIINEEEYEEKRQKLLEKI